ncbi:hypothetical protein [Albimonas pacifica]|uniref:Uncharacterized protein n=1 Tax=Albimonas pacifica TaxID=1114924 RepID=A0A1I3FVT3_9RHOB|nr:hypothetical protein [Albimonas pacifica]SFI15257.1 hypothetical protein SAMN05216258_104547 [Albimonas pacifica]
MTEWNTETEYRTRDGRVARFVGLSPDGTPVFAVLIAGNAWEVGVRRRDGKFHVGVDCPGDILPPRRGVWVLWNQATDRAVEFTYACNDAPRLKTENPQYEWRFFIGAEDQP